MRIFRSGIVLSVIVLCTGMMLYYSTTSLGNYRWAVKTLTDQLSDSILRLVPDTLTIDSLLSEKRNVPDFFQNDTLRYADEKRLICVKAQLIKIKTGSDGDFHLVLKSQSGKLMVAEIPDGNGTAFARLPEREKKFNDERMAIIQTLHFTPTDEMEEVNRNVIVTGIPFWDKIKKGKAPKYGSADKHEIHPVVSILFR